MVAPRLRGADMLLDEASVTATENTVLAAVLAEGDTWIHNAACEPHVQDLCHMLNRMGAGISGIGSNLLHIQGVPSLHGTDFTLSADYLEVGSFIALAAVTGSEITVENASPEHLRMMLLVFKRLGIKAEVRGPDVHVPANQPMTIVADLGDAIPKVDDAPWPGFPADMMSVGIVVATQAAGTVLFHEKLFESRLLLRRQTHRHGSPHRTVRPSSLFDSGAEHPCMPNRREFPVRTSAPAWPWWWRPCAPTARVPSATSARSTEVTKRWSRNCRRLAPT